MIYISLFKWIQSFSPRSTNDFEKIFLDKIGLSPVDFVSTKLSVGSDLNAVKYLYEITSAEVTRHTNCTPTPFDRIYSKVSKSQQCNAAMQNQSSRSEYFTNQNIFAKIGICQREFLNRKDSRPFGGTYTTEMDILLSDQFVRDTISQISFEYAHIEFCKDPKSEAFLHFKRNILPSKMKASGLTEHPIVQSLCNHLEQTGTTRKSVLITIYYAVRMYELKLKLNQK